MAMRSPCISDPSDPEVVIETYPDCRIIYYYDTTTGHSGDIFSDIDINPICKGPAGTKLGIDTNGRILQFQWTGW